VEGRAAWSARPATPAARRALYAGVVLLGGLVAALYARATGAPVFPVDDAYITLHNALTLG
jgi:hypothetical protein